METCKRKKYLQIKESKWSFNRKKNNGEILKENLEWISNIKKENLKNQVKNDKWNEKAKEKTTNEDE